MADTPSDGTPESGASAPPPRRRRPRGDSVASAKPKRSPATKTARLSPARRSSAVADAVAAPRKTARKAATAAKSTATKAVRQAKPKVKAAADKIVKTEQAVVKSRLGKGVIIGGAIAALTAGIAAKFGRKKISEATTNAMDKVLGKPESSEPPLPKMSAD